MPDERFDVNKYLIALKGKPYLPVAPRIVAFREECPVQAGWGIRTRMLEGGREAKYAQYYAEIVDPEGRIVATGTKQEDIGGFGDFIEKAETGAIGRALANAGFGTIYALELDEGDRLADAPVHHTPTRDSRPVPSEPPHAAAPRPPSRPPGDTPPPAGGIGCQECGLVLTPGQNTVSVRVHGRPLCPAHQRQAGEQMGKIASRPAA